MIVRFTAEGIRDLGYWEATNPRLVSKINALISSLFFMDGTTLLLASGFTAGVLAPWVVMGE